MSADIKPIEIDVETCDEPACDDFDTSDNDACQEGLHRIDTGSGVVVQIDDESIDHVTLPDLGDRKIDAATATELAEAMLQAASVLRWLAVGQAVASRHRLGCYTCRGMIAPMRYCGDCGLSRQDW